MSRRSIAGLVIAGAFFFGACGGGSDVPEVVPSDPVSQLQNAANKGPTGVISHTQDVADQLNQRNSDLDSLYP